MLRCFCYITDNDITFVSGCRVNFLNGTISETNEWYHRYTSLVSACGRIRRGSFVSPTARLH
ncbi:hypothetical protein FZ928_25210 [Klebsiella pneumoniae]|uniref:Uncharacterized protein n=1 Tax=Klebsiella pneumoniae TaxID=573 RepID=A0A5C2LNN1_KLEPN|nr:hypothetical protein FZ928_25210 [Klebsiella pneumoniae]